MELTCTGGFVLGIVYTDVVDPLVCNPKCGLEKQGSIVSNAIIYGGECGQLTTCTGNAVLSYSPPIFTTN